MLRIWTDVLIRRGVVDTDRHIGKTHVKTPEEDSHLQDKEMGQSHFL